VVGRCGVEQDMVVSAVDGWVGGEGGELVEGRCSRSAIFRPRVEELLVGRRDSTKLVDGVLKQVELVHAVSGTCRSPLRSASSRQAGR
jgi:hypothetical protein